MAVMSKESVQGLGNRVLLDKIDKLRELGVSAMVPLPQLVVVGDQSAGKSSVLESLTGFHFPRNVTLCTRHATEIICRREETKSIVISIQAVDANEQKAKAFRREATDLDAVELAKIFEEAAEVMGIKNDSGDGQSGSAFSRDILRVEISGPSEDHLTVIDVPGMFENETPGLTTKKDIELVKNMVRAYINESRTIILAVVPCNGDIANQKILTYAAEADPQGKRTLGVLTKPDLAVENATKEVVVDLVLGKRRDLQLGYCVVKNRSADDKNSTPEERDQSERSFFAEAPWTRLPTDRVGIPALKTRLQHLLMDRTKSEFPKVRDELYSQLKSHQSLLQSLGESRASTEQQRMYMGKVAAEFSKIKNFAIDAYYTRHEVFQNQDLKLITRMREINELFSKVLYEHGHTREFAVETADESSSESGSDDENEAEGSVETDSPSRDDLYDDKATFKIPLDGEDELEDVLFDPYDCPEPSDEDIMSHIEKEYLTSRGYELGTFSGEMLPKTFKEQAKKWPKITRAHVSNAILVVHHFIRTALDAACPEDSVREELWAYLLEDLQSRYKRAIDHTEFLLKVEFTTKSITYNPEFEKTLSQSNMLRIDKLRSDAEKQVNGDDDHMYDSRGVLARVMDTLIGKDKKSVEVTRRAIHDVLHSYYNIARNRFVDTICQQVIDHFLLHADDGPLCVLSDVLVLSMTPEQLDGIAGEDMFVREQREKLALNVKCLGKALKILRG